MLISILTNLLRFVKIRNDMKNDTSFAVADCVRQSKLFLHGKEG